MIRPRFDFSSDALRLNNGQTSLLLLFFWLAAVGSSPNPALAATNAIASYSVRTWQMDDGLPQNSVRAIAQTRDGYLWIGTREGLARFDGVRFTLPDEKNAPELRRSSITALCASRSGGLWVATDSGLTFIKDGRYSRLSEADGLLSNQIKSLLEDNEGALWIGSDGGLTRYQDSKLTSFTEKNGLGANSVRGLCEQTNGDLRIATLRGLSTLNRAGNISTFNLALGQIANGLKFVCADHRGRIWTGSNEGLTCLDGETKTTFGLLQGLPDRIVNVAYEDRAGQLWVGTYRGLVRMVEDKVIRRPNTETVFGDWIYTILEDREGNLWVGAEDGLYRLNPARFVTHTTHQGLTHNNVMSVLEDHSGRIWMGTWGGGLNRMIDGQIAAYSSTSGYAVLALLESRDGSLWVGLDHSGGVHRYKDGPQNLFPRQPGLIDAAIRVLYEDRQGALWIGTSKGLNIYRDGRFETFTPANGLSGNMVWAICERADGTCWVGTDGGVSRWQNGRFTNLSTRDGLSTNWVNALYEDPHGTLWIGTRGGGLNRHQGGKFTTYTTKEGLFSDEVYEILEDDFGYLWMSARKGIFRVSKQELEDLDHHKIYSLNSTAFGKWDGLASVQCNGVAKPAGWKARDGRLWFPTIRGVVAADPRIKPNDQAPPVLIEEVLADKRKVREPNWGDPIRTATVLKVAPGRGELEIHYTALSLQAPEKNRFKYRLEGFDSAWVDAGSEHVARYIDLPPRRYQFRVIACNNDGVWNDRGAALALILQPNYWQMWWFKPAIVAGIGLLLTVFYRARVARLRGIERLRIQIAANLHDDVGARLTKVAMVTEQVERETRDTDRSKPLIQNISQTTREIIQAMDEIVWTINPKNDTLDHLASYIFQYAQEYFQHTGVRCRVDMPVQLPDCTISTEARHNLFMAVKEALNNVLKHANATEVRIGLALTDSRLTMSIIDNGRGFEPATASSTGNGLENMKQRLERIGGRLFLESQSGGGTQIKMEAEAR